MRVKTNKTGLASFIRENGGEFLWIDKKGNFVFESEKSGKEWRISYGKSDNSSHHRGAIELSNMRKEGKFTCH